jgi:signal recognition particle subunit SRP68
VSNALALIQHALDLSQDAAGEGAGSADSDGSAPLHVDLSNDDITFLIELLTGELQRHRAIVHIENLRKENPKDSPTAPLIERLHEYPSGGINLASIVEFPPKKAAIPVKPIFLDVAWNYIEYPGKATQAAAATPAQAAPAPNKPAEPQPAKKGWFGFGRS